MSASLWSTTGKAALITTQPFVNVILANSFLIQIAAYVIQGESVRNGFAAK